MEGVVKHVVTDRKSASGDVVGRVGLSVEGDLRRACAAVRLAQGVGIGLGEAWRSVRRAGGSDGARAYRGRGAREGQAACVVAGMDSRVV